MDELTPADDVPGKTLAHGSRWSARAHAAKAGALAAIAACLTLAPSLARAEDDRVSELERKVEVLTQEIADLKLGVPADTVVAERKPRAVGSAKVYESQGISIGGYGEMLLESVDRERQDGAFSGGTDRIDFLRQVFYFGTKFNDELLFNSEVEFEHGGIGDEVPLEVDPTTGRGEAELSGEVNLEFAFIEWTRRPALKLRAGMVLVPVGLTNEMHEPTTFYPARRPDVEQRIIPTTWSANGAGLTGRLASGFEYRAYVLEGLNAVHFQADEAIRGGRQGGHQSLIVKPAFAGRLDYSGLPGLTVGASAYTGDTWQEAQPVLAIDVGAGTNLAARVTLVDAHARADWRGLEARGLVTQGVLEQAAEVSDAIGLTGSERLGERFWGGYVEGAYDLLRVIAPGARYRVYPYARYERDDSQERVTGGTDDPALGLTAYTFGAALKPHTNVVFKAERQRVTNGARTGADQWNLAVGYVF